MRCSEIINILEELAPHRMACEWDNPGLLAGRKEKEVKKLPVSYTHLTLPTICSV